MRWGYSAMVKFDILCTLQIEVLREDNYARDCFQHWDYPGVFVTNTDSYHRVHWDQFS